MAGNMPPKKILKSRGSHAKMMMDSSKINPRVIIRPLRANRSEDSRYNYTTLPPTASLFNKPDFSDIKLIVGDRQYFAHRLILSAASEVFQSMFGSQWAEKGKSEIELQEDRECVKVFESFLYYFYSGTIMISEDDVVALFMLADKYNVTALYDECVKVIENGLKVYTVMRVSHEQVESKEPTAAAAGTSGCGDATTPGPSAAGRGTSTAASGLQASSQYNNIRSLHSSSSSEASVSSYSSDSSDSDIEHETPCNADDLNTKDLVGMETFPLTLVMKMLKICQNSRILDAARYNLGARLCKQITHGNYGVWNDIDKDLLIEMLSDKYFFCKEFVLFKAAKSWLAYRPDRQDEGTVKRVLTTIRYPLLDPEELYDVENDEFVQKCSDTLELVRNAVRYKLFKSCMKALKKEEWTGVQFECRQIKDL